jgi:ABC-type enterochelin transport system substrate-binding protein
MKKITIALTLITALFLTGCEMNWEEVYVEKGSLTAEEYTWFRAQKSGNKIRDTLIKNNPDRVIIYEIIPFDMLHEWWEENALTGTSSDEHIRPVINSLIKTLQENGAVIWPMQWNDENPNSDELKYYQVYFYIEGTKKAQ